MSGMADIDIKEENNTARDAMSEFANRSILLGLYFLILYWFSCFYLFTIFTKPDGSDSQAPSGRTPHKGPRWVRTFGMTYNSGRHTIRSDAVTYVVGR